MDGDAVADIGFGCSFVNRQRHAGIDRHRAAAKGRRRNDGTGFAAGFHRDDSHIGNRTAAADARHGGSLKVGRARRYTNCYGAAAGRNCHRQNFAVIHAGFHDQAVSLRNASIHDSLCGRGGDKHRRGDIDAHQAAAGRHGDQPDCGMLSRFLSIGTGEIAVCLFVGGLHILGRLIVDRRVPLAGVSTRSGNLRNPGARRCQHMNIAIGRFQTCAVADLGHHVGAEDRYGQSDAHAGRAADRNGSRDHVCVDHITGDHRDIAGLRRNFGADVDDRADSILVASDLLGLIAALAVGVIDCRVVHVIRACAVALIAALSAVQGSQG